MKYELKELNKNLAGELYEMYQDIPDGENGQTNSAYGLSENDFLDWVNSQVARKDNKITEQDTPTQTYILYVDGEPVGYICLRTEIDDNWRRWSGNFYYQVRKSARRRGYGTKMLELGLEKLRELGFKEVYGKASSGNIGSARIIEKNHGVLIGEDNGAKIYKIALG